MLIELKFKNFRSFREETTFSMVASSDKTLYENVSTTAEFGGRNILRSAVIYGPNAAGKSNLFAAVNFIDALVNHSAERELNRPIETTPFLFDSEANSSPSEFEITFLDNEKVRYQYGFHVTSSRVTREWLIAYPKGLPQTWYEREYKDSSDYGWFFGRNLKGKNYQVAELTRPDVLFISNAAKLNHQQLGKVSEWFHKSLRLIGGEEEFNPFLHNYTANRALKNERAKYQIRNLISMADLGITDFDVNEEMITEKDLPADMPLELRSQFINKKRLDVFMRHTLESGDVVPLPLEEESIGTQRYFALGGPLTYVLENGCTLFVDELDASLHPLLVRHLVELFHNNEINSKGAQLIFNTHDTTLMDGCLFRRDQIWFIEKDHKGCSHLYPLLDYSPRKDEALAKGYLLGRYGAIPFLGEFQWGERQNAKTKT